MLANDKRPRMFGEEALWYQKRGAARVALRRIDEADVDLGRAVAVESRTWVKGRALRGARKDCRPARATVTARAPISRRR